MDKCTHEVRKQASVLTLTLITATGLIASTELSGVKAATFADCLSGIDTSAKDISFPTDIAVEVSGI